MQQLTMNGEIIGGLIDFTEKFSPIDVLYKKEVAVGFFLNKLCNLSEITKYHTEMFFTLLRDTPNQLEQFENPSCYLTKNILFYYNDDLEKLKPLMEKEGFTALAKSTWNIAQGTKLEAIDRAKLFCLLTAAYALALHTPDEDGFKITPEQAEKAYLGKYETDENNAKELLELSAETDVVRLRVRDKPYKLILKRGEAVKHLENGSKITHIKLIADKHISGRNNVSLTLNIFYNEKDSEPMRTVILAEGEYRFINIVGEYPVLVHLPVPPEYRKNANTVCYAEKFSGNYLSVELEGNLGKIDSAKSNYDLSEFTAVEIAFAENGNYIYLDNEGIICEQNRTTDYSKHYASIEDYNKEYKIK